MDGLDSRILRVVALVVVALLLSFGKTIARAETFLRDGTYLSSHSVLSVEITVRDGVLVDVVIKEHHGGGEKYLKMIEPLARAIVSRGNVQVDGVSGATISSDALKTAVSQALQDATSSGNPR